MLDPRAFTLLAAKQIRNPGRDGLRFAACPTPASKAKDLGKKSLPQLSFLSGTCMRQTICMSVAADLGPVHSLGVGSAITCAPIAIDHYSSPRGARGVRILRWGDACR